MASMERRRRLFFIILSFGLFAISMPAPMGEEPRPQTRRKSLVSLVKDSGIPDVGNPVDLAWQAWILMDQGGGNAGGGLDSASLLRRITPKSIFIAPSLEALPACAEGYQADPMNRCVKNVNINHEAHLDFLVQRLNAMYANLGNNKPEAAASSGSVPTGPLQLDLLNSPVAAESEDQANDDASAESPSTFVPSSNKDVDNTKGGEVNPSAAADDQKDVEDEESDKKPFFHGPQSTKDGSENDESNSDKYESVVPIIDFVDDTNSSYSEVIDYKVESDDKLDNATISDELDESKLDAHDKREHLRGKRPVNDSLLAPTIVFLLTPTKLPVSNGDLIVAHNSSTWTLSARRDNKGNGTEPEEIITVNLPEHLATASTAIQSFVNTSSSVDQSSNTSEPQYSTTEGSEGSEDAETDEPEESETELPGEDNEDLETVEESTGNDEEILTHSEAGMMVTMSPRVQQSSTPDNEETTASKISSEISITDDFVRETILLGLNLHEDSNSTTNSSTPEDKTSTFFADEKIITVTPEMLRDQETTPLPEDVLSDNSNTDGPENEETTEDDSEEKKELTTPKAVVTKQPEFPEITRLYEAFPTDQRELNPVKKIEELAVNENTNENSSTKSPLTSSQSPKESDSSEIMTASSSNNAEAILHQNPPGNNRFSSSIKTYNRKRIGSHSVEFPDGSDIKYLTSTVSENPEVYTEIKSIDDQVDLQKVPETENFFPDERKVPANPAKDFVRFPTYDKNRNRAGYIRFPSEEANSIHTPDDFKNRIHHRLYNQPGYRGSMKNQNLLSSPQKQISWPSWRNDRQGSIRSRSGVNEKPKDRSPIWFWTRMPLLRDPSLLHHPTNPSDINLERPEARSHGTRRINYYQEMSSDDIPRAFARSSPIGG